LSVQNDIVETVKKYLSENKAEAVVVASQGGKSAMKMAEALGKESKIIAVCEFAYSENVNKALKKAKVTVVEKANLPIQDVREMRETLMMFDPGIKAALEVASIAASSKLVTGKYIAVAGSGKGLDTAIVVNTTHPEAEEISEPLKHLKVEKILASPLI
jgi:hypothetical protein